MTFSIIALTYPDHYVRSRNWVGELIAIASDLDRRDASFCLAVGLADRRLMSFESVNCRRYLRDHNGEVKFQPEPTAPLQRQLFAEDVTFILRPGLADVSWVSFESYNKPGLYLRHRDWKLWVEGGRDERFSDDATFRLVPGLHSGSQIH